MPEFTTRWFKRADREIWLEHFGYLADRPTRYLEIGVFEGRSACWVLDNLLLHRDSRAVCVDPWCVIEDPTDLPASVIEATARKNLSKYGSKVTIVKTTSHCHMARNIVHYDLIYIDGSHRLADEWADTGLAWNALAEGGVLVWDGCKGRTRRMVELFVDLSGAEVVWSSRRQIAVRKRAQA